MSDAINAANIKALENSPAPILPPDSSAGPVQPHQRVRLVDIIRGFALLGILLVNWSDYGTRTLENLITVLAEGSFYPMYSFLFGLGFALQLIRAEEGKRPFVLRYFWRSVLLLAIGTIHYIFIWGGDILRIYAEASLLLLLVRRFRPGIVLGLAAAFMFFTVSPISEYIRPGHVLTRANPEYADAESLQSYLEMAAPRARFAEVCESIPLLTARYREQLSSSIPSWWTSLSYVFTLDWWKGEGDILFMFLLGLYVGRRRILREPEHHKWLLIWVAGIGLVIGLAGNLLDTYSDFFGERGIALPQALSGWYLEYELGNAALTLFYVATITLLFTYWRRAASLLSILGHAGRMGLTNYLMQSVVFSFIITSGSIFGIRISGWSHLSMLIAFYALQIYYSWWWFRHFRFGPVEWLWRSLTWWHRQPMRIAPPVPHLPEPVSTAAG